MCTHPEEQLSLEFEELIKLQSFLNFCSFSTPFHIFWFPFHKLYLSSNYCLPFCRTFLKMIFPLLWKCFWNGSRYSFYVNCIELLFSYFFHHWGWWWGRFRWCIPFLTFAIGMELVPTLLLEQGQVGQYRK